MDILVQQGWLGLNSPKIDEKAVIVVSPGTYSRTGRAMGNVDEGHGVRVMAFKPRDRNEEGRECVFTETLFAPERWDAEALNKLGSPGAFCQQEPAQIEIDAAVERARATLEGRLPVASSAIRKVRPEGAISSLHELLVQAIERAKATKPGLTDAEIAAAANLQPPALSRAKGGCRESTLVAVLTAIHKLTGLRLNVGLVEE